MRRARGGRCGLGDTRDRRRSDAARAPCAPRSLSNSPARAAQAFVARPARSQTTSRARTRAPHARARPSARSKFRLSRWPRQEPAPREARPAGEISPRISGESCAASRTRSRERGGRADTPSSRAAGGGRPRTGRSTGSRTSGRAFGSIRTLHVAASPRATCGRTRSISSICSDRRNVERNPGFSPSASAALGSVGAAGRSKTTRIPSTPSSGAADVHVRRHSAPSRATS